jgi:Domain of unknown function (DUF4157)
MAEDARVQRSESDREVSSRWDLEWRQPATSLLVQEASPRIGAEAPSSSRTPHTGLNPGHAFGRVRVQADGARQSEISGHSVQRLNAETDPGDGVEVGPEGGQLSGDLTARIGAKQGAGVALAPDTRDRMEGMFGTSFGDVRAHADGESDALNRRLGAVAFTAGSDIFFQQGRFEPDSGAGAQLLAHELTHVVQQRSMSGAGPVIVGPVGDSYEQEAEAKSRAPGEMSPTPSSGGSGAVQRMPVMVQRAVSAPPTAHPGLHHVLDEVSHAARVAGTHPPANQAVKVAQAAAPTPANDVLSKAQAAQTMKMAAAPPARPDTNAFLELLRKKLAEIVPKSNQEMKDFGKGEKAGQMHGQLSQEVKTQSDKAQEAITGATRAPAPVDGVTPREAGPPPPAPGGFPPTPINAANAVPTPLPDPAPALAAETQAADQRMADHKITADQLHKANDPRFSAVVTAQTDMHAHAATAPVQFKTQQQTILTETSAAAHSATAAAHAQMHEHHAHSHGAAHSEQQAVMAREAEARKTVADTVERMFNETKSKVEAKLTGVAKIVDDLFTEGEGAARKSFDGEVDRRTTEYWLEHPLDAVAGWALGNDEHLAKMWEGERENYSRALDNVLVRISDRVEHELSEAKGMIAEGHKAIDTYIFGLDPTLRQSGQEASQTIGKRFEELQQNVDAKRDELASHLVDKYQAAQQAMDARMKELQESNRGAIGGFLDKLEAVEKALAEFKQRLNGVVTDAEETLDLIINDPIAFLGYLLDALKQGFSQFLEKILEHLKRGLMDWIFGTLATAGIQLPKEFDLKGIIMLVLQVLGVTWTKIRAKIEKIIGPRAMRAIEKIVDYVSTIISGGIEGLWEKIKEDLGGLKDMIISAIQDWIVTAIVKEAMMKLMTMSNPAGAIVEAVIDIYKTVRFFIEKAQQIMHLVETIVRSVSNIARGAIGEAANWVEEAMASTIPVILGFLAELIGLGGLGEKIQEFVKKAQEVVDKAIDAALAKIVEVAKGLFGKDEKASPDERTDAQKQADLSQALNESTQLLRVANTSPDQIKKQLPAIKAKYKMTSLELVIDKETAEKETVHVEAAINPSSKSDPFDLAGGEYDREEEIRAIFQEAQVSSQTQFEAGAEQAATQTAAAERKAATRLSESSASFCKNALLHYINRSGASVNERTAAESSVESNIAAALNATDGDRIFSLIRTAQASVNRLLKGTSVDVRLETHHQQEVHAHPATFDKEYKARVDIPEDLKVKIAEWVDKEFSHLTRQEREKRRRELANLVREDLKEKKIIAKGLQGAAPLDEVDMIVLTVEAHDVVHAGD